jgi:hypothetical protein
MLEDKLSEYEDCLWAYLIDQERAQSVHQTHPLLSPPPEYPLKIGIQQLVVEQVDTVCVDSIHSIHFTLFDN